MAGGRLWEVQGESQAAGSCELGLERQERTRLSGQTNDQQEEQRLQSLRLKGAAGEWERRLSVSHALSKHLLGACCMLRVRLKQGGPALPLTDLWAPCSSVD